MNLILIFVIKQIFPVTYFCFLTSITSSISLLQFQAQHSFSHENWRCKPLEGTVNWMSWFKSSHQHNSNPCTGTLKLMSTNHIIT
jgi:hypothetical protein